LTFSLEIGRRQHATAEYAGIEIINVRPQGCNDAIRVGFLELRRPAALLIRLNQA
jgi:hypothetical protein